MDGTTLNNLHALTPRTIAAIRKADAAGLRVIIATGRPVPSLQPFIDQLALPKPLPAVCFNGACAATLSPAEQTVLLTQGLSSEAARRVLALCEEQNWCCSYCQPQGASASPKNAEQEQQLKNFEKLEGTEQTRVASLASLLETSEPPLKIVAMAKDPEASAAEARAALPEGAAHVIAAEMHIEFLEPSVSKGTTLAKFCTEHLGIPLEEVVAFGDNHNDSEMLKLVGHGVAMRNAKDAVKAVADRVCDWTNDEEGVAKELEALLADASSASHL
eukprot:TRINITY_DN2904_c2_g1_i1.p1 TRINITY_DN2904_c2_g1~~TRINITY_DN2904_c2_g1_i1.p1  ORF type:complete len:320 (-),score=74.90 TRINITY_DN2904_c2_g1_i1:57-878(-)